MKQTRTMSLVESITNTVVGFLIALVAQYFVFLAYHITVTARENFEIVVLMTILSIVRSFVLRRVFETIRTREEA